MSFILVNNFNTTLSAASSSTATTFTVSSSANLPTLASGEILPITLNDTATRLVFEICYVTGISGDVLTVERAQEGTSAQNWNIGDFIWNGPTAGTALLQNTVDAFTTSGLITANGGIDANTLDVTGSITIPNATANNNPVALGQVLAIQSGTAFTTVNPSASTTYYQSISFTAPSNGTVFVFTAINSSVQGADATLGLQINGGSSTNAVVGTATLSTSDSYSVSNGSANTVTAFITTGSTTGASYSWALSFAFVPTP